MQHATCNTQRDVAMCGGGAFDCPNCVKYYLALFMSAALCFEVNVELPADTHIYGCVAATRAGCIRYFTVMYIFIYTNANALRDCGTIGCARNGSYV